MPVGSTSSRSMQISGFDDIRRLTPRRRPVSAPCSSGQRFALGFLQISTHPEHPCRSATPSTCRASRGLSPPSECALPGAPKKRAADSGPFWRLRAKAQLFFASVFLSAVLPGDFVEADFLASALALWSAMSPPGQANAGADNSKAATQAREYIDFMSQPPPGTSCQSSSVLVPCQLRAKNSAAITMPVSTIADRSIGGGSRRPRRAPRSPPITAAIIIGSAFCHTTTPPSA